MDAVFTWICMNREKCNSEKKTWKNNGKPLVSGNEGNFVVVNWKRLVYNILDLL